MTLLYIKILQIVWQEKQSYIFINETEKKNQYRNLNHSIQKKQYTNCYFFFNYWYKKLVLVPKSKALSLHLGLSRKDLYIFISTFFNLKTQK